MLFVGMGRNVRLLLFIYSKALFDRLWINMVPLFYYNLYHKEVKSENAVVYKLHFRCPQVLWRRKISFASRGIFIHQDY